MQTIAIDGFHAPIPVSELRGSEAISTLFHFELGFVSEDHELASAGIVGRAATLTFGTRAGARHVSGIVGRFQQGGELHGLSRYHLLLVPRVWRLDRGKSSRVFEGMTAPEIIREIILNAGLTEEDFNFHLIETYGARDLCIQYCESDWSFISRLLEDEGIRYLFVNDGERELVVFTDREKPDTPKDVLTLGFDRAARAARPDQGDSHDRSFIFDWLYTEEVGPGRVTLRDYDFTNPETKPEQSLAHHQDLDIEVYELGDDPRDTGGRATRIRLQELECARRTARGNSNAAALIPGHAFVLTDHPRASLNVEHLITGIVHQCDAASNHVYHNTFTTVAATIPFRPQRRTQQPRMQGIQSAVVVGPPGEQINTDKYGRVQVRFHWDRRAKELARASCWVRVSQVSAGAGFGTQFTPRVGHEVVVDFLEGNLDRPIVMGMLYHELNPPPYTVQDRTKSGVRTNTVGGSGSNELTFEDRAGKEEIYLHAQKDLRIAVEDDKHQKVGGSEDLTVAGTRTVNVAGIHTETVGLAQIVGVGGAQVVGVGGAQTVNVGAGMALTVVGAKAETVGIMSVELVGGAKMSKIGISQSTTARKDISATAGRNYRVSALKNFVATATGSMQLRAGTTLNVVATDSATIKVGNPAKATPGQDLTVVVANKLKINCGETKITISKDGKITISGKATTLTAKGPVTIDGTELHLKGKGPVNITTKGQVKVSGKGGIGLN